MVFDLFRNEGKLVAHVFDPATGRAFAIVAYTAPVIVLEIVKEAAGRPVVIDQTGRGLAFAELIRSSGLVVEGVVFHRDVRDLTRQVAAAGPSLDMPFPTVIKGGPTSGLAYLAAAAAMTKPGVEVLISSESEDVITAAGERILEIIPNVAWERAVCRPLKLDLTNGSRIIGRTPRQDGQGVRGINPSMIWWLDVGDPPRRARLEFLEGLRRRPEITRQQMAEFLAVFGDPTPVEE